GRGRVRGRGRRGRGDGALVRARAARGGRHRPRGRRGGARGAARVRDQGLAPPLIGAGCRFLLAAACLGAVWVGRGGSLRGPRAERGFVGVTAVTVFRVPYALVFLGETEVTSGLAAVLFSTLPLFAALLARRLLPDQPLTRLQLAGIVLGIAVLGRKQA